MVHSDAKERKIKILWPNVEMPGTIAGIFRACIFHLFSHIPREEGIIQLEYITYASAFPY